MGRGGKLDVMMIDGEESSNMHGKKKRRIFFFLHIVSLEILLSPSPVGLKIHIERFIEI